MKSKKAYILKTIVFLITISVAVSISFIVYANEYTVDTPTISETIVTQTIHPRSKDIGKSGDIYIYAIIDKEDEPDEYHSWNGADWVISDSFYSSLIPYLADISMDTITLSYNIDGLENGTEIYVGYTVPTGTKPENLLFGGTLKDAYIVGDAIPSYNHVVTLEVGKSQKIAVLNGTYDHQVVSADPTIASVLYEGPITGSIATITANYPGTTTIEIKDPSGNVAQIIKVAVAYTIGLYPGTSGANTHKSMGFPASDSFIVGESKSYAFVNAKDPIVESDNEDVATAEIQSGWFGSPSTLKVKAHSAGWAKVVVTDKADGRWCRITVKVSAKEYDVPLEVGESTIVQVDSWSYNYTLEGYDPEIAMASPYITTGVSIDIDAISEGQTEVLVRNQSGAVTAVIKVTVTGTVTEPDQETLTINDDYSFFADVKFDFLGIIQIMRAQFEFIGEQNGKMLWKLAGPPMKKTTETGDEVELGMDYSFEIPYAESSYGNFKLKFKFIGEQNGNYLWELVYLEPF